MVWDWIYKENGIPTHFLVGLIQVPSLPTWKRSDELSCCFVESNPSHLIKDYPLWQIKVVPSELCCYIDQQSKLLLLQYIGGCEDVTFKIYGTLYPKNTFALRSGWNSLTINLMLCSLNV